MAVVVLAVLVSGVVASPGRTLGVAAGAAATSAPAAVQGGDAGADLLLAPASDPERVGILPFNVGEDLAISAVSDGVHAYFGLDTTPGRIVKVRLSDRTQVDQVTLSVGENRISAAVTDGTYGYFGTITSPARVVKVRLSDMTRVGAATMLDGVNVFNSAVSDGTHGYFATNTAPAKLVKVRFSDLTTQTVTFRSGEDRVRAATIEGVFGYFGTMTSPGKVVKMNLASMTHVATLTLEDGENNLRHAFDDGYYAYFTSDSTPARVVKVWIGSLVATELVRDDAVSLGSGVNDIGSAVRGGGYGYIGSYGAASDLVFKVRLSNMESLGVVTTGGAGSTVSAVGAAGRAWFGTFTSPARVVEVVTVPGGVRSCGITDELQTPSWARAAVCWVAETGVTTNNPFSPGTAVTRAQMATFLWRQAGEPTVPSSCGFTDSGSIPSWARAATCWARATGVTEVATFRPGDSVTRQEMAAFLWRAAGRPPTTTSCAVVDAPSVATFARGPVCWLLVTGITTNNPFEPQGVVTRAQMATFLQRLDAV